MFITEKVLFVYAFEDNIFGRFCWKLIKKNLGDLLGGPVDKTPCFQCRNAGGKGSILGGGTKIPHVIWYDQ